MKDLAWYRNESLSLDGLVAAVAEQLARLGIRPEDGRVAVMPDARSVRYYQTLGIVDKPSRYEGRHGVYGYRQLLQLLVVKLLQQESYALHQVQRALAGRSTESLEAALAAAAMGVAGAAHGRVASPGEPPPEPPSERVAGGGPAADLRMPLQLSGPAGRWAPPQTRAVSERDVEGRPAKLRSEQAAGGPAAPAGAEPPAALRPPRLVRQPAAKLPRPGDPRRALIAVRVAPGVTITIDPFLVEDADALVELIAEAIADRAKEE